MSRTKVSEHESLLPEQVNIQLWPIVDEFVLSEYNRIKFQSRKNAIEMYIKNERSQKEIHEITGIHPRNLYRLFRRCISFDPNGVVWGYRALIPKKSIKKYTLKPLSKKRNQTRKTGEFNLMLERYPDIKDLIDDLYLGRNRKNLEPIMRAKFIHKKFVDACREKKLSLTEYPFNTAHLGFRALCRYLNNLQNHHFGSVVSRYGEHAEQKAKNAGIGEQNHPITMTPYQKVQFDGHRIDAVFTVKIKTPEGDEVIKTLDRFWFLCVIDVATRSIIGYSICLNKEYAAGDVMQCIRNAVMPHNRKELTIDGLTYDEPGGFPSERFKHLEWAVWDIICFDNAKSHLANMVRDRLQNLINCSINIGPVDMPMRRSLIERFFKTLETNGFHRLPSTTGSHPKDPRRSDPEKNALKYELTFEHFEELIEVMVSNYNGAPHAGIYYQTPLELLDKRLEAGVTPRLLEKSKQSDLLFLQTTITRTVRGNVRSGKRPYIQYEGVEYRSETLALSAHLIGQELTLHVNVDDLRTIRAFLPDGSELGFLAAAGKWSITPHTLQIRKTINQMVLRKLIHFTQWDDPIFVYFDYKSRAAKEGERGAANKVAHVQNVIKKQKISSMIENQMLVLNQEHQTIASLDQARKLTNTQNEESDNYLAMVKRLNTISF